VGMGCGVLQCYSSGHIGEDTTLLVTELK
jgi:hypothetical protein